GTLVLANGANTYGIGGHTDFAAGTIVIDSEGELGTNTSDITVSGNATLRVTGTTTLNLGRTISLNTNLTIEVTNGVTFAIAGALNESAGNAGALTKLGAGTLILSNNTND